MNLPNYQTYEEEFLKTIATRLGLSGKTWDVFLARFQDKKSNATNKMQPILLNDKLQPVSLKPKLLGLEMGEAEIDETAPISIPLNSKIRLDINLERAGYLLLLEKGTSGKLWCLCPSGFAPEWRHSGGTVTLPLASSRHRYFKLTGSTGWEEILAVITRNLPKLDWLPKPGEPLLQLQEGHLSCSAFKLGYLNRSKATGNRQQAIGNT
ncbi:MAG: DUF4384 domain-containing protein, partial [Coleofasciculus sp. C2-GNP5-27]